ncbi:urease accessory protein [Rhodovibrio sodomensis]|uniref:Urease accessory protein n=1 Tax=Rhodovibrio sodomensis TaxID=1088 RepID=A0ABS1DLG3_9PROT|nr:HupE/UreJ family protein [Rhodovibrio sodomensis]MBK1670948.1 urease accessory protein [Rhodovibrio sodomensis]
MKFLIAFLATALSATSALAHTGAMTAGGFLTGFLHPIGGLDHVLAIVTVGLLAFHVGGRATWLVPASFVGMMVVGGALGAAALALPLVEFGIVLSVVVLGAMVASGRAMPAVLAIAVVGAFAVFHGHAHGTEMPGAASGMAYGLGFVLATALLHAAGLLAGYGLARLGPVSGARLVRVTGGAAACAGLLLFAGVL